MASIFGRKGSKRYNRNAGCVLWVCLLIIAWAFGTMCDGKHKHHREPAVERVAQKPAPRTPREMVLKADSAAWAEQKQLVVFSACVDDGDDVTAQHYLKRRTDEGAVCLLTQGERVQVVERSDGGAFVRVRRPGSADAWWVSARVLDEPDDE